MKTEEPSIVVERCTINADKEQAAVIAEQNGRFRRELLRPDKTVPGHLALTRAVRARGRDFVTAAKLAVASYTFASPFADHSEQDFGTITVMGERLFWEIHVEDPELPQWVTDRTDLSRMIRILRIMLASEY